VGRDEQINIVQREGAETVIATSASASAANFFRIQDDTGFVHGLIPISNNPNVDEFVEFGNSVPQPSPVPISIETVYARQLGWSI